MRTSLSCLALSVIPLLLVGCGSQSPNVSATGGASSAAGGAVAAGGSSSVGTNSYGGAGVNAGGSGLAGAGSSGGGLGAGGLGTGGVIVGTGGAGIGGDSGVGGAVSQGGAESRGGSGTGGVSPEGGATGVGGAAEGGAAGNSAGNGGASTGGDSNMGGAAGSSGGSAGTGTGGVLEGPGTYALPPPSQCHNRNYIDYQKGCIEGDSTSTCGGKCNTINACQESTSMKPYADINFICPRFMLFSEQMKQAAIDDGNEGFNYAVVGHDVDRGGIDGDAQSTCCQCYQLVYAYPSPSHERQALLDPDNPNPPKSGIPIPPPLIVQSFNTAATPTTFDVYMAAGGFGANNACAPNQQPVAASGLYLYTDYPTDGQPGQGGVKPVSLYTECKTQIQWVTTETLSSSACQDKVAAACNKITSELPGLTEQGRESCLRSNSPESPYHLNWSVYVMKVECPAHLTEVTGCKLDPQGLPEVARDVKTAEQAAVNTQFRSTTSSGSDMYETTTMEDCCKPSCAVTDWIADKGLATSTKYNAFYSCDKMGVPITEPE